MADTDIRVVGGKHCRRARAKEDTRQANKAIFDS